MARAVIKTQDNKAEIVVNRVFPDSTVKIEDDAIAIEEPLEIRIGFYNKGRLEHKAISITMRTPGNDFELAAGFLFTEGIIKSSAEIEDIKYCGKFGQPQNTVRLDLEPGTVIDFRKLERHFYTSSSCGVCGKSSIEALSTGADPLENAGRSMVTPAVISSLPDKLRTAQSVFDETGGLHASGLFENNGELIELMEDVGRHNAVDKMIGGQMLKGNIPLDDKILFLSGRASFELVQKAVMARIPVIAAVSAPSSLAVDAARKFNTTLIGFVREDKFNVYTGNERISYEA